MKIYSKAQIYEGDKLTIERQNMSSTDLMERAGTQVFNWLHAHLKNAQATIHVFCGIGNNGGDGLVIARHLMRHDYQVKMYIVNYSDKRSKDFLINYDHIKNVTKKWPTLLNYREEFPEIHRDDIIIDAVFGIGFNRPAADWVRALFIHFRNSEAFTLSIDIPSGLSTDSIAEDEDAVVWADYTLSFVSPKLVFFLPQTAKFTKQWEVLNIGLDDRFLKETFTNVNLIGKPEATLMYRPREKFSHKGTFGHTLIIGGSYGKIGAVTLASRAALSAGAGLVSAYIPKCGYTALQSSFPEAMVITDEYETLISEIKLEIEPTVIGFGVGIGTAKQTVQAFEAFLKTNKSPLVIDADGVNILAQNKTLLKLVPKSTILTPHPKELERLIGKWRDDFDKLKKVQDFSIKYEVIVVIKGAHTITVSREDLYVNNTGNPGLATAGTGDVLTGIITGLISQGYTPLTAALFGVYLHGRSADLAVQYLGYESLMASHVVDYLGAAFKDLFKQAKHVSEHQ